MNWSGLIIWASSVYLWKMFMAWLWLCCTHIKYCVSLVSVSCLQTRVIYAELTEKKYSSWIESEGGAQDAPLPPTLSLQTVMDAEMAKSSCSSDHKALSRALNCVCAERELSPPRLTLGTWRWRKKRRQGEEGQEGMCGWTKWQDGWQSVGRFWHSHLKKWEAGWEVSLIHSFSKSQRLETESGSWLKSGCCVWILNVVCRLVLWRFVVLYFKTVVYLG